MATRQVLTVFALAVLAAGCSAGGATSAGSSVTPTPSRSAGPSGSRSPRSSSTPGATRPSTTTLPTTRQTQGKPLKARNGTRLGSCRDGRCEVIVRPGDVLPFDRRLRTGPVRVLSIAERHLTLDMGGAVVGFGVGGAAGNRKVELRPTAVRGHRAVLFVSRRYQSARK